MSLTDDRVVRLITEVESEFYDDLTTYAFANLTDEDVQKYGRIVMEKLRHHYEITDMLWDIAKRIGVEL